MRIRREASNDWARKGDRRKDLQRSDDSCCRDSARRGSFVEAPGSERKKEARAMRSMKVVAWVCIGLLVVVLLASGASADTRGRLFINKFVYGDPDTPQTCKEYHGRQPVAAACTEPSETDLRLKCISIRGPKFPAAGVLYEARVFVSEVRIRR